MSVLTQVTEQAPSALVNWAKNTSDDAGMRPVSKFLMLLFLCCAHSLMAFLRSHLPTTFDHFLITP
jgi:hypothetical protein